jgi:hypothetical protein
LSSDPYTSISVEEGGVTLEKSWCLYLISGLLQRCKSHLEKPKHTGISQRQCVHSLFWILNLMMSNMSVDFEIVSKSFWKFEKNTVVFHNRRVRTQGQQWLTIPSGKKLKLFAQVFPLDILFSYSNNRHNCIFVTNGIKLFCPIVKLKKSAEMKKTLYKRK